MSRPIEHAAAAIAAVLIVLATWTPVVTVPADPPMAAAPVLV
jgi:hypothetical protein